MDIEGLVEREMTYRVDIRHETPASVWDWCEAHFGRNAVIEFKNGEYGWKSGLRWTGSGTVYFFRNANDAVEFKLRWG